MTNKDDWLFFKLFMITKAYWGLNLFKKYAYLKTIQPKYSKHCEIDYEIKVFKCEQKGQSLDKYEKKLSDKNALGHSEAFIENSWFGIAWYLTWLDDKALRARYTMN